MVLRQGIRLAAWGVLIGLGGAVATSRVLRGLLYGISPLDPCSFAVVPLALVAAALLACWLPARRAARLDPVQALRWE